MFVRVDCYSVVGEDEDMRVYGSIRKRERIAGQLMIIHQKEAMWLWQCS